MGIIAGSFPKYMITESLSWMIFRCKYKAIRWANY